VSDVIPADQVKHMKWWGWGVEGVAFHHEDKPALAGFILKAIGIDVTVPAVQPIAFDDLEVPASILDDDLRGQLTSAVGEEAVVTADLDRVVHTYGKSLRDLLRLRGNQLPRVPDVVVYPADEGQVQSVPCSSRSAVAATSPVRWSRLPTRNARSSASTWAG
jgi:alkyldihydroxyacetonephosphate synthase